MSFLCSTISSSNGAFIYTGTSECVSVRVYFTVKSRCYYPISQVMKGDSEKFTFSKPQLRKAQRSGSRWVCGSPSLGLFLLTYSHPAHHSSDVNPQNLQSGPSFSHQSSLECNGTVKNTHENAFYLLKKNWHLLNACSVKGALPNAFHGLFYIFLKRQALWSALFYKQA